MIRIACPLLVCAVLASTPVLGADFSFDARVSVLPSLSVTAAPTGGAAAGTETLAMIGTQDQCLDVACLADGETVTTPATPADETDGIVPILLVAPEGSTLASHML